MVRVRGSHDECVYIANEWKSFKTSDSVCPWKLGLSLSQYGSVEALVVRVFVTANLEIKLMSVIS